MVRRLLFPLGLSLSLLLAIARGEANTAQITWTITPGTETYINDQTKIAFPKSVGRFRIDRANPAWQDGTATFSYLGKRGLITIFFMHRGPAGCGQGEDCAGRQVDAFRTEMKKIHGEYDMERSLSLRRRGSPKGRSVLYHFLAFAKTAHPAFSEIGGVEIGEFVFCYRGTFKEKAGLDDLAGFLRAFGVTRG